jgi:hypothetical protein
MLLSIETGSTESLNVEGVLSQNEKKGFGHNVLEVLKKKRRAFCSEKVKCL